ncbi:MAG: non-canonical purine NTP pyrophosphatase, partial [Candidatus Saccharibacteria bacterium]|nr:non-canonical purine NTP pyrophosphatase [Candidatus Saccharibacteria bacterium]
MKDITLVTGNSHKLKELQAIFPPELHLMSKKLELEEIQGDGIPENIVKDKLTRAYAEIGTPVIVEDVSAELACLNGLPGPFIKFFEGKLGKGALWKLAKHHDDTSATIRCIMGYFDGHATRLVEGALKGEIVPPRGKNGFGFDFVFIPDGYDRTMAEMSPSEKNALSHRAMATRRLVKQLTSSSDKRSYQH